jgi:hypothetical protein
MQGGVFGSVSTSDEFVAAISGQQASGPSEGAVASVAARPYELQLPLAHTALIMVDFQRDFLEEGGFGAALGNDVGRLQVGSHSKELGGGGMEGARGGSCSGACVAC